MVRLKFLVIYYFLSSLVISSHWFVSAKPFALSSNTKSGNKVQYNLQNLEDDALLTTDIDSQHDKNHLGRTHRAGQTDHKPTDTEKSRPTLAQGFTMKSEKQKVNAGYDTGRSRQGDSWKGKVGTINDSSKKVINRQGRGQDSNDGADDDDHIQSKDEDDDDDVQLIIIPKKTRKRLRPKVQDDEDYGETVKEVAAKEPEDERDSSENSKNHYDSENSRSDSDNSQSDSENSRSDSENFRSKSENFRSDSDNPQLHSGNSQFESKNFNHRTRHPKSSRDDDISVETVPVEDKNDGDKSNDRKSEKTGDYDLHVNVKDRSGTNVKLTGDLPGNIGSLVAEGEAGGMVQIKNTNSKVNRKVTSEERSDGAAVDDITTDDVAQSLIKMKSGKLKHAPYPSTILLKPTSSDPTRSQDALASNANDLATSSDVSRDVGQEVSLLKSNGGDKYSPQEISETVLKPTPHASAGSEANEQTNKQPDNNVFSSMEFENGDDELMATSRLLDIARKADDDSSLKEIKDPSNTKPISSNGKQRSTTFPKPTTKLAPEDYKKQSEDIDNESNNNWYKLQSLEDRVVDEGSSRKTGKDVGSYNGQNVSVVSPGQLQLLQTEYPSYPAYLTPLQRTKVKNS